MSLASTPDSAAHDSRRVFLAEAALFGVTVVWGTSFALVRWAVNPPVDDPSAAAPIGPLAILFWRFVLAGLILLPLAWIDWRRHGWSLPGAHGDTTPRGLGALTMATLLLSSLVVVSYGAQAWGMRYTTAANSALITGLNAVFTPLLAPLFGRARPGLVIYGAAALCVAGIALITGGVELKNPNVGDWLTLLSAFVFALHIIGQGTYTSRFPLFLLSAAQLWMSVLLFGMIGLAYDLPLMPAENKAWLGVFYLAVACTATPFLVSLWAQRILSESRTALIYAFEPVVGAGLGILILGEPFSWTFVLGGALVMAGIIMSRPPSPMKTLLAS